MAETTKLAVGHHQSKPIMLSYNEKKANLADWCTADSDSSQGEYVSRHAKIKRDLPLVMDCIDKCRAFGDQSAEKLGLLRRLIPHGDS